MTPKVVPVFSGAFAFSTRDGDPPYRTTKIQLQVVGYIAPADINILRIASFYVEALKNFLFEHAIGECGRGNEIIREAKGGEHEDVPTSQTLRIAPDSAP
jgi:hypothetical protein